ncbi:endonuclease V [Xanthomonas fragariae LMG 25863]|nr:endonuclease V [Xanthomonas fragariae LMG 25863]
MLKKLLAVRYDEHGPQACDRSTIVQRGEIVGWALRSKPCCNLLIVSPGHRVAMESALHWTLCDLRSYRLPEPTRPGRQAGLAPRWRCRRPRAGSCSESGRYP